MCILHKLLQGLAKYAQYSISVAARSVYGVGPYSEPVVRRTMEDSKLHSYNLTLSVKQVINDAVKFPHMHTVPSVPKEVVGEVLNSTAVSLSWNPPDNPNGVILGYQLTYYGYRNPEMIETRQVWHLLG